MIRRDLETLTGLVEISSITMAVSTTRIQANPKAGDTMYYKSGNFEAFARPRKPKGVDEKSAYLVGSGIGSLAAAVFLIRDGHMARHPITILEAAELPGGALDGIHHPAGGFINRGGRKHAHHVEC